MDKNDDVKEINKLIKGLEEGRLKRNWSQSIMAKKVGLSDATYSRWINGEIRHLKNSDKERLIRIAPYAGLPFSEVLINAGLSSSMKREIYYDYDGNEIDYYSTVKILYKLDPELFSYINNFPDFSMEEIAIIKGVFRLLEARRNSIFDSLIDIISENFIRCIQQFIDYEEKAEEIIEGDSRVVACFCKPKYEMATTQKSYNYDALETVANILSEKLKDSWSEGLLNILENEEMNSWYEEAPLLGGLEPSYIYKLLSDWNPDQNRYRGTIYSADRVHEDTQYLARRNQQRYEIVEKNQTGIKITTPEAVIHISIEAPKDNSLEMSRQRIIGLLKKIQAMKTVKAETVRKKHDSKQKNKMKM